MRFPDRFDQRALAWTGLMLLTILLAINSWPLLLLFSFLVMIAIQFTLPEPAGSWRRLSGFYWFYLLNFIFVLFFSGSLQNFLDWTDWSAALLRAAYFTLRLVDIIALMLYLSHWLQAERLIMGLIGATSTSHRPGRIWQRTLWTLLFAYHFLPLLGRDVQRMRLSVLARGHQFRGVITRRIRVYLTFLLPLLQQLFRRADVLVAVLATRGFDPGSVRTMYHRQRLQLQDWILALSASLLCSWVLL